MTLPFLFFGQNGHTESSEITQNGLSLLSFGQKGSMEGSKSTYLRSFLDQDSDIGSSDAGIRTLLEYYFQELKRTEAQDAADE